MYVNGVDQGELVGIRAPDYDGVRHHSFACRYLQLKKAHLIQCDEFVADYGRHLERLDLQRRYVSLPLRHSARAPHG